MRPQRNTSAYLVYALLAGITILAAACASLPPAAPAPAQSPVAAPTTAPTQAPATAPAPTAGLTDRLTGNVTYMARIALSPDAVVEVTLQDVSRADAPATIIATQTIETQGAQAPIPYELNFDPAQIAERNTYVVRARITEGGQLTWTSTRQYRVLTRGAPVDNVEIVVERVAPSPAPAAPGLTGVLTGTVTYMPRIALAPDAIVDVTLQDVTDRPAPPTVVASQTFQTNGAQAPIQYEVRYDPAQIDPQRTYQVAARIVEGGEVKWINMDRNPALTQGAKATNIDIVMTQAPESAGMAGPEGVITGTVTYVERIALPPTAVIQVQLLDVSLQDVAAKVLASQRYIAGGRQVPIPYELSYDPAQIDPRHTYAVAARITIDNQLRWINTQQYPVLTRGAPTSNVEIVVQPVGSSAGMGDRKDLSGTVTYLQRIALPPVAIIEVSLQDVSKQDAPAELLDSQKIPSAGRQVPIPYTLKYDPAQIDPRHTYTVSARITVDGQLTWISTQMYRVLTDGAPSDNVEIIVQQVP